MQQYGIINEADVEEGGKHWHNFVQWAKKRSRRVIPPPARLVPAMKAVVEKYRGKVCCDTNEPLITPVLEQVLERQLWTFAMATAP